MFIARGAVAAALLLLTGVAFAAEPVRRIAVYVEPFYNSGCAPGERPRVAVGKQYNDLLASDRREDILAARDLVVAKPKLVTTRCSVLRRQGAIHRHVGGAGCEDASAGAGR